MLKSFILFNYLWEKRVPGAGEASRSFLMLKCFSPFLSSILSGVKRSNSLDFCHHVQLPVDIHAHTLTSIQHRLRCKDPHFHPLPQVWEISSRIFPRSQTAVNFSGSDWITRSQCCLYTLYFLLYPSNSRGLFAQRDYYLLLSRTVYWGLFQGATSSCPPDGLDTSALDQVFIYPGGWPLHSRHYHWAHIRINLSGRRTSTHLDTTW